MFRSSATFRPVCQWALTDNGILVCPSTAGVVCSILSPYVIVWDLCAKGYPLERVARLYETITEDRQAYACVTACLEAWIAQGLWIEAQNRAQHLAHHTL